MRKKYITPSMKVAEAKFHEALLLVISVDNSTVINPKDGSYSKDGDATVIDDEEW